MSGILQDPFDPQFTPSDPFLPTGMPREVTPASEVDTEDLVGTTNMNKDEARAVHAKAQALLARSTRIRKGISILRKSIDEEASPKSGSFNFNVDVSKKALLRKAVKKAFGIKSDVITYEMYIAALEAKHRLEKSEAEDYIKEA